MEKEISSGAMLGIVLIALAAVIALGFGVFAIAKSTANEGVVGVQDGLAAASSSVYDDYNQKVVTGTQVVSAYNNFNGKNVAIVVSTNAMNTGTPVYAKHTDYYSVTEGSRAYLNYNAILAKDANGGVPDKGTTQAAELLKYDSEKGNYVANGFALDDTTGAVVFDNNTAGMSRSGNGEYIPTSGRFNSNLIVDGSGTILGIIFTQTGK